MCADERTDVKVKTKRNVQNTTQTHINTQIACQTHKIIVCKTNHTQKIHT